MSVIRVVQIHSIETTPYRLLMIGGSVGMKNWVVGMMSLAVGLRGCYDPARRLYWIGPSNQRSSWCYVKS